MTIAEQAPRNTYIADGVNDTFAFTFRILDVASLDVFVEGVQQALGSDYIIVNLTQAGGDVVFQFGRIPIADSRVDLVRDTELSQEVDYNPYDPFPAETHELALDKLTMITQELQAQIGTSAQEVGLPLDPSGLFWDARSLRIKNLVNPADDLDAATKQYVDAQIVTGFDPTADAFISGSWEFDKPIIGTTTGNVTLDQLDLYTRRNANEIIPGNWRFADGGGNPRKVAGRNPRTIPIVNNYVVPQEAEGSIIRVDAAISTITLVPLDPDTTFTIFAKVSAFALQENGAEIHWMNGAGATPPQGDRNVARASVIQVQYEEDGISANVYGGGLS